MGVEGALSAFKRPRSSGRRSWSQGQLFSPGREFQSAERPGQGPFADTERPRRATVTAVVGLLEKGASISRRF